MLLKVTLLILLQRLAQESGHQEVMNAPLLFLGHSAAGPFGPTFASAHPERTIAFVGYHSGGSGGGGARWADMKVLSQIPGLLLAGGKDLSANLTQMRELWKQGRSVGAPWTFAIEPDAAHSPGAAELKKTNDLLIPWIEAVLRQRLSENGPALRAVTDVSSWAGNIDTGDVAPFGMFSGSKSDANWFPDEAAARGWRLVARLPK